MSIKSWEIKSVDDEKVALLKNQLGQTRESLCRLFVARGLDTYEKAKNYFSLSLDSLHHPALVKDMDKAVDRIISAVNAGERILLFGDYDVDGTTAVAMLRRFLATQMPAELLFYYIPDRYTEGYGLSRAGIEYAIDKQVSLIITLDCGITSNDLIDYSHKEEGIDFIVCDHHLPGKELPAAIAILNPKRADCAYPFKELCGTGVAFKLIIALCEKLGLSDENYLCYLDLVALATGADVVPITDENRLLVHFGLEKINQQACAGIEALKKLDTKGPNYNLNKVVFSLAPKINAAGRIDHGRLAVELLLTDDEAEATELAKALHDHNETRKQYDLNVTKEALDILRQYDPDGASKSTVVFKEGWHKGVLGIVASRLIETYYRPTIVLTAGERHISGSARSIEGFNIYEAIYSCKEYLVNFGGHFAAAGLTIAPENVEDFKRKFESIVSQTILPEQSVRKLLIDLELQLDDVDFPFYQTLCRMEPFGHSNPEPVFLTRAVTPDPQTRIVGGEHVRFVFRTSTNRYFTGIGFTLRRKYESLGPGTLIDIAYTIDENIWNDRRSLQLRIIDIRPSKNN